MHEQEILAQLHQARLPVAGVAIDYADGHVIPAHSHACPQLLYAVRGVMVIEADSGQWVVPPTRGVWLQAGVAHQVRMRGPVHMRSLYVTTDVQDSLPQHDCVIDVSPLLRELILAATHIALPYSLESRDGRVMTLLLDELRSLPVLPFHLPWPSDPRVLRVCQALAAQPHDQSTALEWANQLAMSLKTFHRQFQRSTGITFGRWRQQARLLKALEALAEGQSVLAVALQHGYQSQSAFAAAFKQQFGVSPSTFYRD